MAHQDHPTSADELESSVPGFEVQTFAEVQGGEGIMAHLTATWDDDDQLIIAYADVFTPTVEESHTVRARIQGTQSLVADRGENLGPAAAVEAAANYARNLPQVSDDE